IANRKSFAFPLISLHENHFTQCRKTATSDAERRTSFDRHLQRAGRWPCNAAHAESRRRSPGGFDCAWWTSEGCLRLSIRTLCLLETRAAGYGPALGNVWRELYDRRHVRNRNQYRRPVSDRIGRGDGNAATHA